MHHICMMHAWAQRSDLVQVEGAKRARGRLKGTLVELVRKDMITKNLTKNMPLDRIE